MNNPNREKRRLKTRKFTDIVLRMSTNWETSSKSRFIKLYGLARLLYTDIIEV